ncbi:MAG: AlbA family DNA-binding domain-containing protein [Leadbetterella sp.]
MELKDLKTLVQQGENQQLEFKLKSNHPEKIVREVVAFANSRGGRLIIGVADNKELVGLKYADEDLFLIQKAIQNHIEPEVDYSVDRVHLEREKEILIFNIPQSSQTPHAWVVGDDRIIYVREGDKALQASKEMREILKGQAKARNYSFQYGDKETILMRYLDQKGYVTLQRFIEEAAIPKKVAARTLVLLVLAGVLRIQAHEQEDRYSLV